MTDMQDMLIVERPSDGVVLLRLNRPAKRNALAADLLGALADALDAAARDTAVRCAIVTGGERFFAAGADIGELAGRDVAGALADIRPVIWSRIRGFAKPLIAAVEGWSLGAGNELVMCCDLVVAGRGAKFGQPESNLGIVPGAGGTAVLARLVGRSRAMRMVLLGDPLSAEEAKAAGLIAEIVEDGAALGTALALAVRVAGRAPLAMRQAKALVQAAYEMHLGAHLQMERQCFSALFGTADRTEGISAFLEKRDPHWTGA
jgi:enoyl-CoA hydratase